MTEALKVLAWFFLILSRFLLDVTGGGRFIKSPITFDVEDEAVRSLFWFDMAARMVGEFFSSSLMSPFPSLA
jgi:hypothetical protein